MRYLGWFLLLIALAGGYLLYRYEYLPLRAENQRQRAEIAMWTKRVAELGGSTRADTTALPPGAGAPTLTLLQDDLFAGPVSLDFTPAGRDTLRALAAGWRSQSTGITVAAFTDNRPVAPRSRNRFATNWEFGALRATAVCRLLADNGIGPARLRAVSGGAYTPVADNNTEAGRRQNRRLEITIR